MATTTFPLIPEQLSLAKDLFFFVPPTITEVSLSNDFQPSAKWPLIASDWGSGARRGLPLTFPPLGGALRHSPSLAVSVRPPLHLVGGLFVICRGTFHRSRGFYQRRRGSVSCGRHKLAFFFFACKARNGAGRAPPRSASTTDRY